MKLARQSVLPGAAASWAGGETVKVGSPCTGVCRISPQGGRCEGCDRTLEQIANWSAMGDDEKRAILRTLSVPAQSGDQPEPPLDRAAP